LGVLVDQSWNLTPVGQRYEALMSQWDTELALAAGADGAVDFRGFYGDYQVTVGGRTFDFTLRKGVGQYQIVVAEPAAGSLAILAVFAGFGGVRRPFRSRGPFRGDARCSRLSEPRPGRRSQPFALAASRG
jgi:hypothetical protein